MNREIIIAAVSAAVGAIASMGVASFTYLNKDRELDLQMVRIQLSILGGENKDTSAPARRYALKALEQYSRVEIPDEDFDQWALNGTIPALALYSQTDLERQLEARKIADRVLEDVFCSGGDPAECEKWKDRSKQPKEISPDKR